jgi:hypothetical protein
MSSDVAPRICSFRLPELSVTTAQLMQRYAIPDYPGSGRELGVAKTNSPARLFS